MPAYAYLRKSSVRDATRDVSHEVQESAVRGMAALCGDGEGLVLLSDWDKSGQLGADKRPGYRALLEAIESGRATAVYSYSLSRLGRSLAELARLIKDCNRREIPVRLHADHVDTSTASGRLLTHVLGAVAQFEADVASERTRAAQAARLARGERIGARFFGEVEGEDAGAVLAAFDEAGSFAKAAALLNGRGVPTRGGRTWWPSTVAGVIRHQRSMPAYRSSGVPAGPRGFTLSRLLICPACGTPLTGSTDRGGVLRYSCSRGTVSPHLRRSIGERLILPAIRDEVALLVTPQAIDAAALDTSKRVELEDRRLRVLDMFEAGHIDRGDRERRLAAITEGLARLDNRRVMLDVPTVDWSWDPGKLNSVLRALFDGIDLDPQSFQPVGFRWAVPEWRAA